MGRPKNYLWKEIMVGKGYTPAMRKADEATIKNRGRSVRAKQSNPKSFFRF